MEKPHHTVSPLIGILLKNIDEGYKLKAWHGPNLKGSLRGLSLEEVCWRPGPGRHNIWEIVIHVAYWKYVVRRRILGEKRGSFPETGSNWFLRPVRKSIDFWNEDLRLLDEMHRGMRETIEGLVPSDLSRCPGGSRVDIQSTVAGIAAHDIYHAGQIQLIKRLYGRK